MLGLPHDRQSTNTLVHDGGGCQTNEPTHGASPLQTSVPDTRAPESPRGLPVPEWEPATRGRRPAILNALDPPLYSPSAPRRCVPAVGMKLVGLGPCE